MEKKEDEDEVVGAAHQALFILAARAAPRRLDIRQRTRRHISHAIRHPGVCRALLLVALRWLCSLASCRFVPFVRTPGRPDNRRCSQLLPPMREDTPRVAQITNIHAIQHSPPLMPGRYRGRGHEECSQVLPGLTLAAACAAFGGQLGSAVGFDPLPLWSC